MKQFSFEKTLKPAKKPQKNIYLTVPLRVTYLMNLKVNFIQMLIENPNFLREHFLIKCVKKFMFWLNLFGEVLKKYIYAAIIQNKTDDEGEIKIMCLKANDSK